MFSLEYNTYLVTKWNHDTSKNKQKLDSCFDILSIDDEEYKKHIKKVNNNLLFNIKESEINEILKSILKHADNNEIDVLIKDANNNTFSAVVYYVMDDRCDDSGHMKTITDEIFIYVDLKYNVNKIKFNPQSKYTLKHEDNIHSISLTQNNLSICARSSLFTKPVLFNKNKHSVSQFRCCICHYIDNKRRKEDERIIKYGLVKHITLEKIINIRYKHYMLSFEHNDENYYLFVMIEYDKNKYKSDTDSNTCIIYPADYNHVGDYLINFYETITSLQKINIVLCSVGIVQNYTDGTLTIHANEKFKITNWANHSSVFRFHQSHHKYMPIEVSRKRTKEHNQSSNTKRIKYNNIDTINNTNITMHIINSNNTNNANNTDNANNTNNTDNTDIKTNVSDTKSKSTNVSDTKITNVISADTKTRIDLDSNFAPIQKINTLEDFLKYLQLEKYMKNFIQEEVELRDLPYLLETDIGKLLDNKMGPINRFKEAVKYIRIKL